MSSAAAALGGAGGGLRSGAGILIVAVVIVIAWTAAAAGTRALGTPADTVRVLGEGVTEGWLLPNALATYRAVVIGFVLAVFVGVVGGAWLGRDAYWRAVLEPVLLGMYSIPKVTLYPVLILFLGLTMESRVAMSFIHAVFPILFAVMTGVREIEPVHLRLTRSLRVSPPRALLTVYLPSIAPTLVAGARMGFSLSIIGVVLAELFAAKEGLGRRVMDAYGRFDLDAMFAVILFLFLSAMAVNGLFWLLERRLRRHLAE